MSDEADALSDGWQFVTGVGGSVSASVLNEAMAAAPAAVRNSGEVMPRRRPSEGVCLICGQAGRLSREHVPPRSAGNDRTFRAHSLTEWLARDSLEDLPGGRFEQGGVWGYTLCETCNNRTGRFSDEYRRWAATAARLLTADLPDDIASLDAAPVTKTLGIRIPDAMPGSFARQVLSMMCSVAGPWRLTDEHPELRGVLLDDQSHELPDPLRMGMALCAGPSAVTAGPSIRADTAGRWAWIAVLAHPPLAFELELAGSSERPPSPMCEIGHFLNVGPSTRATVDLDVIVAFTHTIFPGDWRTRRQIEDKLGLDGLPEAESAW